MRNLNAKEADYTKLEEEVTMLKCDLEKTTAKLNTCLKFEKSSEILTNIIDSQRPPSSKTGVGYERGSKHYDCTFKGFVKEGSCIEDSSTKFRRVEHKKDYGKEGYKSSFYGYCYSCNYFGHRARECRKCDENFHGLRSRIQYGHLVRYCRYGYMKSLEGYKRSYTKNKHKGPIFVWRKKLDEDKQNNENSWTSRKNYKKNNEN